MPIYPFQPEILDVLPEELVELFRGLEDTLITEICSRLKLRDKLNEVTIRDIKALRSHGVDLKEIKKAIRKTAGISEKKLNDLLADVVARNQSYHEELIQLSGVTKPDVLVGMDDIEAIRAQTAETCRNITQSIGFLVDAGRTFLPPAKAYQWALDSAVMQIDSGAISYSQAVKSAIKQLAGSGLKIVDYESGHRDQVDVAVRRAVMTGVSQLCAKYTEQSADYLDTTYFEVSAHAGARDKPGPSPWSSHKDWQGKVYSTRSGDIYPNIYEVCGLDAVDGLEGANCRHRRFPWVEGVSERTYTDEQLAHIDDGLGCTYDGKAYTAYEATQMQRSIERTIRKLQREKTAYKAAGLRDDERAVNIRLRRLSTKYKEFSAAAGLPKQRERMQELYVESAKAVKLALPISDNIKPMLVLNKTRTKPAARYADVTEQWRKEATPNSHIVQDLHEYTVNGVTYKVDGHNVVLDYSPHEKEIAELLEKEFGGEIFMVPRVNNPERVATPDYLFRGFGYDLKTLGRSAGTNTIINRIKKARRQSSRFVIDITEAQNIDEAIVQRQVEKIFKDKETCFVDTVIFVRNMEVYWVVKRA
nr:MAG TPA: minor capsid protein [Caudoviricetes sp.]